MSDEDRQTPQVYAGERDASNRKKGPNARLGTQISRNFPLFWPSDPSRIASSARSDQHPSPRQRFRKSQNLPKPPTWSRPITRREWSEKAAVLPKLRFSQTSVVRRKAVHASRKCIELAEVLWGDHPGGLLGRPGGMQPVFLSLYPN